MGSSLPIAVIITIVVFGGIVQVVTAILIIRCIQNIRRISCKTTAASSSPSASTNDSRIEMKPIEEFLDAILREKPKRFTPQNIIDFTQNYAEKLGSGGNGTVYKGQFPNGLQIAAKVLHGTSSKKAEEQFMAEVATMGRTHHVNLVKLYGFCFEESLNALVYEYMEKGSLDKYLFDQAEEKIELAQLYDIAIGTAKGIRYLHEECRYKIVHYDIKPANILLTATFQPKVADFGLAKLCDRNKDKSQYHATKGGGRGTPGYAAPEMWLPLPVTDKADVYSFGMLLLEMLGQRKNYDVRQVESQEWFPMWVWKQVEKGDIDTIISTCGVKEEKEREKAERLCQVAMKCIQYQADARPSINCVVQMLEGRQEITAIGNPFEHMSSYNSSQWTSTTTTETYSTTTTETYSTSKGTSKYDSQMSSQTL